VVRRNRTLKLIIGMQNPLDPILDASEKDHDVLHIYFFNSSGFTKFKLSYNIVGGKAKTHVFLQEVIFRVSLLQPIWNDGM